MPNETRAAAEHHVKKCITRIEELRDHLRKDIAEVDEPKMQVMFETSAEVLTGLSKAFYDYLEGTEEAFKQN